MQEDPVVRYEPGKVVIETALGPVSYFDPALLGSFTGLLAAFALASLVGLISSGSAGTARDRARDGQIGVPAVLLFAAVTTLIICTFVAYMSGVETGAADYRAFLLGYIIVSNLLVTGLSLAVLAIVWLFICFEVLARYAVAARLIFHSLYLGLVYYWVINISSMTAIIIDPPLELQPVALLAMIAGFASIHLMSFIIRLFVSRRTAHEPSTVQVWLIPALGASSAFVAIYLFLLPVGVLFLWNLVLGVEQLRDAGFVPSLLILCAPTYMILVLVQVCLPLIPKAIKRPAAGKRLSDWVKDKFRKRQPPPSETAPPARQEQPD